jgi:hypothetical protein
MCCDDEAFVTPNSSIINFRYWCFSFTEGVIVFEIVDVVSPFVHGMWGTPTELLKSVEVIRVVKETENVVGNASSKIISFDVDVNTTTINRVVITGSEFRVIKE